MIRFCIGLGVVFAVVTGDPNAILAGIGLAVACVVLSAVADVLKWLGVKL